MKKIKNDTEIISNTINIFPVFKTVLALFKRLPKRAKMGHFEQK